MPRARCGLEGGRPFGLRRIANSGILASVDLGPGAIARGARLVERHLGIAAEDERLLAAGDPTAAPLRLQPVRRNEEVQAAGVGQLVGSRTRPRGFHRGVGQHMSLTMIETVILKGGLHDEREMIVDADRQVLKLPVPKAGPARRMVIALDDTLWSNLAVYVRSSRDTGGDAAIFDYQPKS